MQLIQKFNSNKIVNGQKFSYTIEKDNNISIITKKVKIKSKIGQNVAKKRENLEDNFIKSAQIERKKDNIKAKQDRKKQFFARNKKQK